MHQSLNIPLTAPITTRRDSRRVVALVGGIVFGACVGLLAFRLPFTLSTTVTMSPADAATIRILKTNSSADTLAAHLGTDAIFPGAPWTFGTLLAQSQREMTVSVLPDGSMAYVVDTALPESMRETAVAFGMQVIVDGQTTAIAPLNVSLKSAGHRAVPSALLPWHDGEVWDGDRHGAISLDERGLTLRHLGIAIETAHPTVPEETTVTAYLAMVTGGLRVPEAFRPLLASPAGAVLDILSENGGTLLLTNDRLGDGYVLTTSSDDLTSEELASIGKDIMNRSILSTQSWTLEDGSTYQEIVGSSDDVAVEIRAEEDFTYVSLKSSGEDVIRMTKTPDQLTIANREIDVAQGKRAESECLHNAHSWLLTDILDLTVDATVAPDSALSIFIGMFGEIAINNGKIRLCW